MKLRDPAETRQILTELSQSESWIIDGLGPLKILEERLQRSDLIYLLRIPLWRNYWWLCKRQLRGLFARREELPENCFESTPGQTLKMIRNIWNVHHGLWPQLDRILKSDQYKNKVILITDTASKYRGPDKN
jgi:hypothetical protein